MIAVIIPKIKNNVQFGRAKASICRQLSRWPNCTLFLIFGISCCLTLTGCHRKEVKVPPKIYPVKTTKVTLTSVPRKIEAIGHVTSIVSVALKAQVEGELKEVYFQPGQEVEEGDPLFLIDPRPYEAVVLESRGKIDEIEAKLALSLEKVGRYRSLVEQDFFAEIDYEKLQMDVATYQAELVQAQGALQKAEVDLDHCTIKAPITGMMGVLDLDRGNVVGDQTLSLLNQMDPIRVDLFVPEYQISSLLRCQPTQVNTYFDRAKKEGKQEGWVKVVDNQVNEKTGMVKVQAHFPNPSRILWPGQFVYADVVIGMYTNVLVLPFQAIQLTQQEPIVYVVQDQKVAIYKVQLGPRVGDLQIIEKGLSDQDEVVLEGGMNLPKGAKIRRVS
jgi:multidrug efflux system membrane fusion protein